MKSEKMALDIYNSEGNIADPGDENDFIFDDLIDFCIETNSCDIAFNHEKKKKKKGKRPSNNPTFMPALRILRTDIRRKYGIMLNTVVNSHDLGLLGKFFREFAHPKFIVQEQIIIIIIRPELPLPVFDGVQGTEGLIHHFALLHNHLPDSIFQMSAVKVCKRLGQPGSRVEAEVAMSGTLIRWFREGASPRRHKIHSLSPNPVIPQPNLDEIVVSGIMTLSLDEHHRIVSIQLSSMQFNLQNISLTSF